jgi:tRNA threonylcarbamoyladenosine biosynthesis protein TsaB
VRPLIILALEFSTLRRSVALLDGPRVIDEASEEARRGGSPFPLIQRVLGDVPHDTVEAIAIGLGPGSYTGIRSALAIAQGWHLAKGALAIGVSSAEAIVFEAWRNDLRGPVEIAIDAQRGEIYSGVYELNDAGFQMTENLEIRAKPRGVGKLIGPDMNAAFPSASAVGFLAQKKSPVPPETLEAIYLREPSFVKAPAPRVF